MLESKHRLHSKSRCEKWILTVPLLETTKAWISPKIDDRCKHGVDANCTCLDGNCTSNESNERAIPRGALVDGHGKDRSTRSTTVESLVNERDGDTGSCEKVGLQLVPLLDGCFKILIECRQELDGADAILLELAGHGFWRVHCVRLLNLLVDSEVGKEELDTLGDGQCASEPWSLWGASGGGGE